MPFCLILSQFALVACITILQVPSLQWDLERIRSGSESELFFLSWPLIGKRDLNFSLFTLRSSLNRCKGTNLCLIEEMN